MHALPRVLAKEFTHLPVKDARSANKTFEGWRVRDNHDLVLAQALALYFGSFSPVAWANL